MADSSKITVNYFCLGALLIFIGSVLLCALGFTVVLPFEATRSWTEVRCVVLNSSYDSNVCSCDEQLSVFDTCVSKYPCLQVYVIYYKNVVSGFIPLTTTNLSLLTLTTAMTSVHAGEPESSFTELETKQTGSWWNSDVKRQRRLSVEAEMKAEPLISSSNSSSSSSSMENAERLELPTREMETSATPAARDFFHQNIVTSQQTLMTTAADDEEIVRQSTRTDKFLARDQQHYVTPKSSLGLLFHVTPMRRGDSRELKDTPSSWSDGSRSLAEAELESERRQQGAVVEELEDLSVSQWNASTNVAKLYRSWDDSFHTECSLTECGDDVWNVKEARRFKADWGQLGQAFTCFYNPGRPESVIIERTSPVAAIHAVVWPCLFLATGIALWLGLCLGCWSVSTDAVYNDEYSGVVIR